MTKSISKDCFTSSVRVFCVFLFAFSINAVAGDALSAFNRKDFNEAYRIWSANPDTPEASYGIGRIVLEGLGAAPRNAERGMSLIHKSASSNYRPAISFLADHYERTGNTQQAIKYLERLSDNKDLAIEQRILALLAKSVKGDPATSKQYCETSFNIAKLGGQSKQLDSAVCALNGLQSSMTKEESLGLLKSIANDAYLKMDYLEANRIWLLLPEMPETLHGLGVINLKGQGVKRNIEKGIQYLEKSANLGNKDSAIELSRYYSSISENDKALNILKKGCDTKDVSCSKLQVEIYSKTNATLSKEVCEKLQSAKYSEGTKEYTNYLTCVFKGLSSGMSKDDASKKLKDQLLKEPSINTLVELGPDLLNPNSTMYDLSVFEGLVFSIDPKLENAELRAIAKSSKINEEFIADLPNYNDNQKQAKNAARFIAALGGNKKNALLIAKIYSIKAQSDPSFIQKTNSILALLNSERPSLETKKIELNILKAEQKINSHLNALSEVSQQERNDDEFLKEHFDFQFQSVLRFLLYPDKASDYKIGMASILAQAISTTNIQDVQSKGITVLESLVSFHKKAQDKADETEFRINEKKLESIIQVVYDLKKKGVPAAKIVNGSEKPGSLNKEASTSTKTSEEKREISNPSNVNAQNKSEKSGLKADEYSKYKYECDQSNYSSCTKAAEILLGPDAPDDFKRSSARDKKEAAIRLLEKAANQKDNAGAILLYDVLDAERTTDARDKVENLLRQQFFYSSSAGQLRKLERELRFDPIKTPAKLLMNKKDLQSKCDEVERIKGSLLSPKDLKIANEVIDGFTCKGLRKLQ